MQNSPGSVNGLSSDKRYCDRVRSRKCFFLFSEEKRVQKENKNKEKPATLFI